MTITMGITQNVARIPLNSDIIPMAHAIQSGRIKDMDYVQLNLGYRQDMMIITRIHIINEKKFNLITEAGGNIFFGDLNISGFSYSVNYEYIREVL